MNTRSCAYVRLCGSTGECFRRVLQTDWLPVVDATAEVLDGGEEYGQLKILSIDASRLTADQKERLVDWIWRKGDNRDRRAVSANVTANRSNFTIDDGVEPEIMYHDPVAWG